MIGGFHYSLSFMFYARHMPEKSHIVKLFFVVLFGEASGQVAHKGSLATSMIPIQVYLMVSHQRLRTLQGKEI
jgi:hypothetical protein